MADLSVFRGRVVRSDLPRGIDVFVPDLRPVWGASVTACCGPGGALLAGFMNPAYFLFDHDEAERSGMLVAKHRLP
jgi:hypothetical protein